jgi:hypothetical protein
MQPTYAEPEISRLAFEMHPRMTIEASGEGVREPSDDGYPLENNV